MWVWGGTNGWGGGQWGTRCALWAVQALVGSKDILDILYTFCSNFSGFHKSSDFRIRLLSFGTSVMTYSGSAGYTAHISRGGKQPAALLLPRRWRLRSAMGARAFGVLLSRNFKTYFPRGSMRQNTDFFL